VFDLRDDGSVSIGRDGTYLLIYRPFNRSPDGGARLSVKIRSSGLSAESTIDLSAWGQGESRMIQFFDDLAADWKGWVGVRSWYAEEGGLALNAEHPPVGEIGLRVTMNTPSGVTLSGEWKIEIVVPVEPGQLDSIARSVRTLFERHS
jgi:hypothetical protein